MINKKNLWFLTLFSMVLVLSVYYVTMPNELLIDNNNELEVSSTDNQKEDSTNVSIEQSDIISALKVEDDNELLEEISDLKKTLTDVNVSVEDKNKAFEELKNINQNSSVEEKIENKIKEKYNKECFVKIDNDQIRIVIGSNDHSTELANEIMRLVQEEFDKKMYISVQFQN